MGKSKKTNEPKPNHDSGNIKERLKEKLNASKLQEEQESTVRNTTDIDDDQFKLLQKQIDSKVDMSSLNSSSKSSVVDITQNSAKIFVAAPCYNGTVHVKFMQSVMKLQMLLAQMKIGFEFYTIPFDSLIPRARNACATRFMQSKDSTHLMFIDADIEFNPRDVIKMLQEDKDVLGGIYSKKSMDFDALYNNFKDCPTKVELLQSAGKYAFNFKPQKQHKVERGVVEVLDAPTGFLMIKKQVIQKMRDHYPETEYLNDVGPYAVLPDDRFFDLFPSQIFEDHGKKRYLSEDYGFCRLWQRMGGEIFADLSVQLAHHGQFAFLGNPLVYLKHNKNVSISK
jgi:hypothetical protein